MSSVSLCKWKLYYFLCELFSAVQSTVSGNTGLSNHMQNTGGL